MVVENLQLILTLSGAFVFGPEERDYTLVNLDAGNDAALIEKLYERSTVVRLLVEGLVEENNARDVLTECRVGGKQKLSVESAVFLGVLDPDVLQTLAHGGH